MKNLCKTGIDALKEVPWGTHVCLLYEAEADLLEVLVPYMRAGLEQGEFCLWITAGSAQREAVQTKLRDAVPDLARHGARGNLELVDQHDWYYAPDGTLDLDAAGKKSKRILKDRLSKGLTGMRMAGSGHWRSRAEWEALMAYEQGINQSITRVPVVTVCCYPLGRCGPCEIAEVVSTHQHALVRRSGHWTMVENAEHRLVQKRVEESEKNYRRIFETAANLITSVNNDGVIVDCNRRILDVLGYEQEEILGQNMSVMLFVDDGSHFGVRRNHI